jgi:hypothetical protein
VAAISAQETQPSEKPSKADRKTAKREKNAKLMKMEEEGEPSYRKHSIFGIKINNDGYGLSYEIGRMKTPYRASIFQFEINEKKHSKEDKQSTGSDIGGGFVLLGNPFVYGKQNIFYQAKLGIGQQYMIGGKGNKNGVGVYAIVAGGFAAGLLRAYYLEVESPPNSGFTKEVKYDSPDSTEFLNPAAIVGGTGFGKGWSDMEFVPGAHAKTALRFDWGRFNTSIIAVEVGFNFEYYTKKVVQMVHVEGKNFFANGYLSILFGSRK